MRTRTARPTALDADAVRRACDPRSFAFETTAALPPLSDVLGQPRAVAALEFGAGIASHGFNLFALGLPGSGKTTLIREHLERRAATQAVPPDLCYVHNFSEPRRPRLLSLPAGRGAQLKHDLDGLVRELQTAIPSAFEGAEYAGQRDRLRHELEDQRAAVLARLEEYVQRFGFRLLKTPGGLFLTPVVDGQPLSPDDQDKLKPEQLEKLARLRTRLETEIEAGMRQMRELERGTQDALQALDRETASFASRHRIDDLRARYAELPEVVAYLDAVQADIVTHADDFRPESGGQNTMQAILAQASESPFTRYRVNVLVDHQGSPGAPVVVENNPTYHNLIGRIEHRSLWNAVVTDFTYLKPGALHKANGGYLIIPARECLLNPYAWEGLKRSLKDRTVRIEELGSQLSLISTVTLEPEPLPLDVKVVLIGHPQLYQLLMAYDEDFHKLFKVRADFTTDMERTTETEQAYALFVNAIAGHEQALPFDAGGVARIVEYGSRLAGDQTRLSTRFGEIADLIREAAYRAGQNTHAVVTAEDVKIAEQARRYRANLVEERVQQAVADGTLLIDTRGQAVGRVNGLAVVGWGDHAFGHPARITATVGPGQRGVISIEREVELSGPIHGKGVLILSGYLLRQYGASAPLSLSASLVFEQSYSAVEGDSASLAELYALVSALAGKPLRQDVAVTGSVNQHGQVQAVGGVTEKIEGFFDVCQRQGLTGTQGVLIPDGNRAHLMLRDDVVAAVRAARFNVWPVADVDAGLELLCGLPVGQRSAHRQFPAGSLHRAVSDRLADFAKALRVRRR
jgi:lon-related putative ATP-dependent protease